MMLYSTLSHIASYLSSPHCTNSVDYAVSHKSANTGPLRLACATRHNPGISRVQLKCITSYAILLINSYIRTLSDDKSYFWAAGSICFWIFACSILELLTCLFIYDHNSPCKRRKVTNYGSFEST